MFRLLILPALCLILSTLPAHSDEIRVLTLNEVLQLARENNRSLAVFTANLKAAEGELKAAGAFLNPELGLEIGRGRATRDEDNSRREYRLSLEQPIELPAKRGHRREAATAALSATMEELNDVRLHLDSEVKQAFYRLLMAQKALIIMEENVATAKESLQKIKLRVKTGDASEMEMIKARVELLRTTKEYKVAQAGMRGMRATLSRLTGGAIEGNFLVSGEFDVFMPELTLGQLTEKAMAKHPLIRRQQGEIRKEEASLAFERASRFGDVRLNAFYGEEIDKEFFGAGISMPLPLWYQRSGEIAAATARTNGAKDELEDTKARIAALVARQFGDVEASKVHAQAFEEGLLKDAEEALSIATFSYEQGETSLLELLDAQRVHAVIRLEHDEALYSLAAALARLEQAVGGSIHD